MTDTNRLQILMFGWEFPPFNSGGLGTACQGLTKALVRNNTDITFVLPRRIQVDGTPMKFVFADSEHILIREIDSPVTGYMSSGEYDECITTMGMTGAIYGKTLFEEVARYSKKAREIAKKEHFDVLHAHDWLSFGAGIEAKKVSGKPLVAHVHATEFDRTGNNSVNQRVYDLEKYGMQFADKVIAVSHFTKQIIIRRYGIPDKKISVVHNAIDPGHTGHDGGTPHFKKIFSRIVLFVGRLTLQKGPDIFLRAAAEIARREPDVAFIIAGAGDMERQIIRQCADMGISDRVFFTGFLRGAELNKIYQAADVYVMPSVSEPFGITVLEALNNGTPVLVSKQSGVSEVLTHVLKVDFWDVDEMVNKLVSVLNYKALKECLSGHGRHEVNRFSWDRSANECVNVYKQCLAI